MAQLSLSHLQSLTLGGKTVTELRYKGQTIWSGEKGEKKVFLRSLAALEVMVDGVAQSLEAVPMTHDTALIPYMDGDLQAIPAAAMDITDPAVVFAPDAALEASTAANMQSDMPMEITMYANLRAYLEARCINVLEMAIDANGEAATAQAAPGGALTGMGILAKGEAAAQPAEPISGGVAAMIAPQGTANALPGAAITALAMANIEAEATLSAIPAASMDADGIVAIEGEATPDRDLTVSYTANFWDGDTLLESQVLGYEEVATPPNKETDTQCIYGWTLADGTVASDFIMRENKDFYAVWESLPPYEILAEREVAFAYATSAYMPYTSDAVSLDMSIYKLTEDTTKKWYVEWDGTLYECDLQKDVVLYETSAIKFSFYHALGNPAQITGWGSFSMSPSPSAAGEPFCINLDTYSSTSYRNKRCYIYTKDSSATHTIRITRER